MFRTCLSILALMLIISIGVNAQCCTSDVALNCTCHDAAFSQSSNQAPIGLMGDHYHAKGGIMLSYRYMNMTMSGNRFHSREVGNAEILGNYMRVPNDMTMNMHMIGAMYAPSNKVTLMLMANYLHSEMTMSDIQGHEHRHSSDGLGDTRLWVLSELWRTDNQSIHLNVGISIPTGSISEKQTAHSEHGNHHHHTTMVLPYAMQLGSGTWDVLFGVTYIAKSKHYSWGAQALNTFRTGENDRDYKLGNNYELNGWINRGLTDFMSISTRFKLHHSEKIFGADQEIMAGMSPTADASNYGGTNIFGYVGLNFRIPSNWFKGTSMGFEWGLPIYQYSMGYAMNNDRMITVGIKQDIR